MRKEKREKIRRDFYRTDVIKDTVVEIMTPEKIIHCNSCAIDFATKQLPYKNVCPFCGIQN